MQQFHNATIDPTQPQSKPAFHNSTDFTGQKFGRLTVIEFAGRGKRKLLIWKCKCNCGVITLAYGHLLKSGGKQSCGCLLSEVTSKRSKTHGMHNTITYKIWRSMIRRCEAPNDISYPRYGAIGIRVCKRWRNSFEAFFEDMGERPSKEYQIERKNNNGDYKPSNCYWATRSEQARNRCNSKWLTFRGEKKLLIEWAEELGFNTGQIWNRLLAGWTVERTLTEPIHKRKKK